MRPYPRSAMGISLLTYGALALVLYFGWALADPVTLKEVEDRIAHSGSAPFGGMTRLRMRNGLGLLIGVVLLATSLYRDLRPEASEARRPESAAVKPLTPPAMRDQAVFDRIDDATLHKQIERQQSTSRTTSP